MERRIGQSLEALVCIGQSLEALVCIGHSLEALVGYHVTCRQEGGGVRHPLTNRFQSSS